MTTHRAADPDDVGAAWRGAETEIPEGWFLRGVVYIAPGSKLAKRRGPHWRATAARRMDLGLPPAGMCGVSHASAAAALWRLADLLSSVGRRQAFPRGMIPGAAATGWDDEGRPDA